MKSTIQHALTSFCATLALLAVTTTSHAVPVTYNIGAGSAPGFSATWLHAGSTQSGGSGYFSNGAKAGMTGTLILDMDAIDLGPVVGNLGSISGSGDFGQGLDTWTLAFTGADSFTVDLVDDITLGTLTQDLLSLNYSLTSLGGKQSTGTFYFADRDFNGGTATDGPNYIGSDKLYLWGNNWVNENGASDRAIFVDSGNIALGLDLYGVAQVPEPAVLALLCIGLLGIGVQRHFKTA